MKLRKFHWENSTCRHKIKIKFYINCVKLISGKIGFSKFKPVTEKKIKETEHESYTMRLLCGLGEKSMKPHIIWFSTSMWSVMFRFGRKRVWFPNVLARPATHSRSFVDSIFRSCSTKELSVWPPLTHPLSMHQRRS